MLLANTASLLTTATSALCVHVGCAQVHSVQVPNISMTSLTHRGNNNTIAPIQTCEFSSPPFIKEEKEVELSLQKPRTAMELGEALLELS